MAKVAAAAGRLGMIYRYIILLSLAFGGGWQINQWRHDSHEKQAIEAAAVAQRELHAMEQKRSNGVIAAQNVARTREIVLRRDADSARNALDSLRTQSDAALQSARTSHDACIVTANAQAVIQSQCSTELQALARDADGHASDAMTLRDAWPR